MRVVYLFLLNVFITNAQEIVLQGTLVLNHHSLENIHIINLSNKKTAISDANGKFTIEAQEDDLLVFSAIHIDYWRQSVKENDIKNKAITVKLTAKIEKLDEVVVEQKIEVTAQEMGIIDYKPKVFTPAERRYNAATRHYGLLSLDPIINWVSGRTKMLKNDLKIEKKELAIKRLSAYFDEEYFTHTLKIPLEYHNGFKFFAVEHENLYNNLQDRNKNQAKFSLAEIAQDFLEFLKTNP